jgi:hypothetical protein
MNFPIYEENFVFFFISAQSGFFTQVFTHSPILSTKNVKKLLKSLKSLLFIYYLSPTKAQRRQKSFNYSICTFLLSLIKLLELCIFILEHFQLNMCLLSAQLQLLRRSNCSKERKKCFYFFFISPSLIPIIPSLKAVHVPLHICTVPNYSIWSKSRILPIYLYILLKLLKPVEEDWRSRLIPC